MAELSEASKKLLKERKSEVDQKSEENQRYRASEAASAGKVYQESTVRKTEAGRYEGLQGLGAVQDIKTNKALKDSGAD